MIGTGMRRVAAMLGPFLVLAGLVGVGFGVGQVLTAMADDFGDVAVPMRLRSSDGLGASIDLLVGPERYDAVWVSGVPTDNRPDTDPWTDPAGVVVVHARDSTPVEQLLSRADVLVRGVALLVAALALLPVLRSVADGRPFQPGHDRRLWVVAACVVVGGYVGPLLPWRASASVLARLDGASGISAAPTHHLEAFVVAALVVLVGAVLRAGTPARRESVAPSVPVLDGWERHRDQADRDGAESREPDPT